MKKSLLFVLLLFVPSSTARAESSFAGTWDTTFGPMTLTQEGKKTRLTATVKYPSQEVRDIVLSTGMEKGAATSYDRLDEVSMGLLRKS